MNLEEYIRTSQYYFYPPDFVTDDDKNNNEESGNEESDNEERKTRTLVFYLNGIFSVYVSLSLSTDIEV